MKRILLSLITIGIVSAGVFGATKAFFTDTEKSVGNTFSAGTIDIGVGDENVWTKNFQMGEMKPSQTDYIDFVVRNLGTNPVNVFKKLDKLVTDDGVMSESECTENGGIWDDTADACDITNYIKRDNIDSVILYDLKAELFDKENQMIWWQALYDGKDETVAEIKDKNMFLGMIPAGWYMEVRQSYHMKPDTENWAQGDKMTFDIVLTGEQLKGELAFENKEKPDASSPEVLILFNDGIDGKLTYKVKDSKFNFSFVGNGLVSGTQYSLIRYSDPWPGSNPIAGEYVGELGNAIADGTSKITISGDTELNASMLNAKLWLVKSSDYSAVTKSMIGWNPASYLFETGLMDYYDADL